MHPVHIETRYSIRTRILDYLWAQIPIVVTDGDITSEWVRQFKIGEVVPQFDVEAVARALISILSKPKDSWAPAFEPLGERFSWSRVVSPLRRYCSQGSYAPDRKDRQEIRFQLINGKSDGQEHVSSYGLRDGVVYLTELGVICNGDLLTDSKIQLMRCNWCIKS